MFCARLKIIMASAAGLLLFGGLTSTAQATLITTSGTTSGGSVSATADFEIVGSTLEITLTNTTGSVNDIAQVLDGLAFTLIGGSGVTLTDVIASGFEDCTSGTCTSVGTFQEYPGNPHLPPFDVPEPYGWTYVAPLLSAGNGSFKPGGIVNGSVSGLDGIPNREHNDYLTGPVQFDFSFTTAPTGVEDVVFYWGTTPETTNGNECTQGCIILPQPTPEPGSIALLGLALSALAFARRRSKR